MLYRLVLCCTDLYNVVQSCTMLWRLVQCCTDLYNFNLELTQTELHYCTLLYRFALLYRVIQSCTLFYTVVHCCIVVQRQNFKLMTHSSTTMMRRWRRLNQLTGRRLQMLGSVRSSRNANLCLPVQSKFV